MVKHVMMVRKMVKKVSAVLTVFIGVKYDLVMKVFNQML